MTHTNTSATVAPAVTAAIRPAAALAASAGRQHVLWRVAAFARPYAVLLAVGLMLMIVDALFNVLIAWVLQVFIDTIHLSDSSHLFTLIQRSAAVCVGVFVLSFFGHMARGYGQALMGRDMGLAMFHHANRLPYAVARSRHTGDLSARVTNDVQQASKLLGDNVNDLVANVISCAVAFVYLAHIDLGMALIAVAVGPVTFLSGRFFDRRLRAVSKDVQDKGGDVRANLQEFLQGMQVVRAFGREDAFIDGYVAQRTIQNRLSLRQTAVSTTMWRVSGAINDVVGFALMFVVAVHAVHGFVTSGAVLSFFILFNRVQWPFVGLSRTWGGVQQAFGAGARILQVLDTRPEPIAAESHAPSDRAKTHSPSGQTEEPPALQFDRVTFTYPVEDADARSTLFRGLSLLVRRGDTVALVGPSGAGKTTLAQLALGLYTPDQGTMSVFGHSTRDHLTEARGAIAYVPQVSYLFTGTIRENIAYGRPEASDEMIEAAARAAHAHEFIERMEQGYDSPIGEHGATLSGGQRQRIAIARAFLRDAPIVLLDEATSALDHESERTVQESLSRLTDAKTTLIIAHRLSTVRGADRVVVLDQGRVAEEGTYEELLAKQGLFAQLHAIQFDAP